MRYLVALGVTFVTTLLLLGVLRNHTLSSDDTEVPSDELLAYDISPGAGVVVGLQQQTKEIRLTVWGVVSSARPEERFNFGVQIDWRNAEGKSLGDNLLGFETRVSFQTPNASPTSFAARLAYSNELVTDSRTVRVLVPEFSGGRPTQMHLSSMPSTARRVLVRATFPERRHDVEIAAVDRRMSLAERLELVRDRTSVAYDDLAFSLRTEAISTWQRRLDAAGIEGKNYRVERLLIGSGRSSAGLSTAQRKSWQISRDHALAINVLGNVRLRISTAPHIVLSLAAGVDQTPNSLTIGESGFADISVGHGDFARTLVLHSATEAPQPITVTVASEDSSSIVGRKQLVEGSTRLLAEPMVRRIKYYLLNPEHPVMIAVAPGQEFLGLSVRSTHAKLQGSIDAEIDQQHAVAEVSLTPSLFEQWSDETAATDAQELYIRIPHGTKAIALRGSAHLRVAPFTADPAVVCERLTPEYDVPIEPASHWKFAAFDVTRIVPIRPDNLLDLVRTLRTSELLAQSRIVSTADRPRVPEETLQPAMETVRRHVIESVRWGPDFPLPEDVLLSMNEARRGYVPSKGPRAGRVRIVYRLQPDSVGRPLDLLVDGTQSHREETVAGSGTFDVMVPDGLHSFQVRGAEAGSQVLLEATPIEAAGTLRRRNVHRVLPGQVVRFLFDKHVETAKIVITTYLQGERFVALRYSIRARQLKDLLHSVTPMQGEMSGVAAEAPEIWYWELGPARHLNQYRSVITLGNDIANDKVTLVLRNAGRASVFVGLVMIGQGDSKRPKVQRFWTTEEP